MVGREVTATSRTSREISDDVAISVDTLSGEGFRDVSFEVRRGEIFGIAGLVGAGRTEVARALFGVTKPISGSIRLFGEAFSPMSPRDSTERGIQLVPEDRRGAGLMVDRTILENASLAQTQNYSGPLGLLNFARQESDVNPLLQRLRMCTLSLPSCSRPRAHSR